MRPEKITEQRKKQFRALVSSGMVMQDIGSNVEIAERLQMCPRTWYSRLADPDKITVGELRRLRHLLGITMEEISPIL